MKPRLRRVLEIGCVPQERLAKEVFVVVGLGAAAVGVVWAAMYAALGKPASGLIPLAITIAVVPIFARFVATKRLGVLPDTRTRLHRALTIESDKVCWNPVFRPKSGPGQLHFSTLLQPRPRPARRGPAQVRSRLHTAA